MSDGVRLSSFWKKYPCGCRGYIGTIEIYGKIFQTEGMHKSEQMAIDAAANFCAEMAGLFHAATVPTTDTETIEDCPDCGGIGIEPDTVGDNPCLSCAGRGRIVVPQTDTQTAIDAEKTS